MTIQTVRGVLKDIPSKKWTNSKLVCELHVMLVHPIYREYKDVLNKKLTQNYPIISHDITNVNSKFRPNLACVGGKKVINKPSRVEMEEYVRISEDFYKLHKFITLTSDVLFFNRNVFMITSERKLNSIAV